MLDHQMPGLFQTHLRQCLGSGWQVHPPLSAPVPFPPFGKDALSASSLPRQTPVLIHFGRCCRSSGWCLLPLDFSPLSQLDSPEPLQTVFAWLEEAHTPAKPLQPSYCSFRAEGSMLTCASHCFSGMFTHRGGMHVTVLTTACSQRLFLNLMCHQQITTSLVLPPPSPYLS